MRSDGEIVGVTLQGESPNWAPLNAAVGEEVAAGLDRILDAVVSPWWENRLAGGSPEAIAAAERAVRQARASAASGGDP